MSRLRHILVLGCWVMTTMPVVADRFAALPDSLPTKYAVLGVRAELDGADTLLLTSIFPKSPAARAGLRKGDRILAVDGYRIPSFDELGRYIRSRQPESEIDLLLLREAIIGGQQSEVDEVAMRCSVTDRARLYFLMGEQGLRATADGERHESWRKARDDLEKAVSTLLDRQGVGGEFNVLHNALVTETGRYYGDCRLADVQFALTNPLKVTQLATALTDDLGENLASSLATAAIHLDLELHPEPTLAVSRLPGGPDSSLVAQIVAPLLLADHLVSLAVEALADSDRLHLQTHVPALLNAFDGDGLDYEDSTETLTHIRTLRLAKEVDLAMMAAAAAIIAPMAAEPALKRIRRISKRLSGEIPADLPSAFRGPLRFAAKTDIGWVLVGDKGDNFYGTDAALIVDLGGDDTYVNNCGAPVSIVARGLRRQLSGVGIIIDFDGRDRYVGNAAGSLASGIGGVGLLVDVKGDDIYQGDQLTQGAAFCGVGMLFDRAGDDVYLAQSQAQGVAFFGLGILLDGSGSDFYSAAQMSQGFGSSRGFGVLVDRRGDDRYVADRKVQSSYGTPGVYGGWSQGVGWGIRGFTSGGIGLLLDRKGSDEYQAGNFSQGTGYFFGLGILVDEKGDDRYRGTRYTQGAAAHQAVGILLDKGGDDDYSGLVAANQAGAWDASIAILEDRSGNDRYAGRGLSQGAAAMNGIGVLYDWGGGDRYSSTSGQGDGGSTKYWGGRGALNVGILIDRGGGFDNYDITGRADGIELRGSRIGLFSDR